jgi:hypothetical protein
VAKLLIDFPVHGGVILKVAANYSESMTISLYHGGSAKATNRQTLAQQQFLVRCD